MAVSGCVTPGIRPELHSAVQIDTTLHRSESRVIHGFQRFALSFNRTVVMAITTPSQSICAFCAISIFQKKGLIYMEPQN
jgi:hypothetical protein